MPKYILGDLFRPAIDFQKFTDPFRETLRNVELATGGLLGLSNEIAKGLQPILLHGQTLALTEMMTSIHKHFEPMWKPFPAFDAVGEYMKSDAIRAISKTLRSIADDQVDPSPALLPRIDLESLLRPKAPVRRPRTLRVIIDGSTLSKVQGWEIGRRLREDLSQLPCPCFERNAGEREYVVKATSILQRPNRLDGDASTVRPVLVLECGDCGRQTQYAEWPELAASRKLDPN